MSKISEYSGNHVSAWRQKIDKTVQSNPECITRGGKRQDIRRGNRGSKNIRAHVEISRDLFRDRDWIPLPRVGIVAKTCPPLFSIYGALWKIRGPLFRPLSVNNPPMMHLSSNFRWKFHPNFYPISSTRPYLLRSPPSHPFMHTRRYGGGGTGFDAVSSIICSRRVNLSRARWEGTWKGIPYQPPPCPLGDTKRVNTRTMTVEPVSPSTYELYSSAIFFLIVLNYIFRAILLAKFWNLKFNSIYFLSILYLFRVTIIYIYIYSISNK